MNRLLKEEYQTIYAPKRRTFIIKYLIQQYFIGCKGSNCFAVKRKKCK